jgi:hypothetical protein
MTKFVCAVGLMSFAFAACSPAQAPAVKTISLRIQGTPAEAAVVVDDESMGQLDFVHEHGVALPPGVHHITVKAEGYFPFDREVEAKPGAGPIHVDVALVAVPD